MDKLRKNQENRKIDSSTPEKNEGKEKKDEDALLKREKKEDRSKTKGNTYSTGNCEIKRKNKEEKTERVKQDTPKMQKADATGGLTAGNTTQKPIEAIKLTTIKIILEFDKETKESIDGDSHHSGGSPLGDSRTRRLHGHRNPAHAAEHIR